ncbi:hypothetical protein C6P42_003548 [Pichia californica]|nr:hypothetical protein C6P42_003548 [[Candida] californica]
MSEIRFLLPQAASNFKSFVLKTYPVIKKEHPYLPVLIRECQGVQPTVVVRLEKGVEVKKHVANFSEAELTNLLQNP